MKNGKIAPPGYVLPNRPQWQGGWNIRSVAGAAIAFTWPPAPQPSGLRFNSTIPVEMGDPILWVRGTAVFQPFAALVLWKHYAGSRLISSGVRKDIWIAFGATIARRSLSGLFDLLVSLPHARPQEHRQPDEPAWLRNLG